MSLSDEMLIIRAQMVGARQVAAESQIAAGGIEEVGAANATAGREAEFAAEKQFLFGQSLYSLRRYLFYGTTAAGAFAYGVGKLGLAFDDAKAVGVSTFSAILGSNQAANAEMNRLIQLTHESGLSLTDLAQGEQQLLTFGFGVKQSTGYLEDMAIAAQKLHQGTSGLETFLGVFARIKDQGQLTGRTLLQLIRDGVPALQILQKQLHLSPVQLSEVEHGQLVIPARYALPALATGMRGLPGTFDLGAQFGQFKSYAGQLAGVLLQPLFHGLSTGLLPGLDKRLAAATAGEKTGGTTGMLNGLDPSGTLTKGWTIFSNVLHGSIDVLHGLYTAAKPFLPLLTALATLFASVASHGQLVEVVLYALAARYIYTRTASLALVTASKLVGGGLYDLLGVTAKSSATAKLYALWLGRSAIAQTALGRALTVTRGAQQLFQRGLALGYNGLILLQRGGFAVVGMLRTMAVALGILDAELMLTPVGWIAIGVVAAAVLALLILKVGAVRNAFTAAGHGIASAFSHLFDWIKDGFRGALDFVINAWNSIHFRIPGFRLGPIHFGGFTLGVPRIPLLAAGGDILMGGAAVVGDRGPELLNLPAGARVTPLRNPGAGSAAAVPGGGGGALVDALIRALEALQIKPSHVIVDGRSLAEITYSWEKRLGALE